MVERERAQFREPAVGDGGHSARRRLAMILMALAIVGAATYFALQLRDADARLTGDGRLLMAPAGPYKVRPDAPGGMAVEGRGSSQFAASEGAEPEGRIDLSATPETPVEGRRARERSTVERTGQSVQARVPAAGE